MMISSAQKQIRTVKITRIKDKEQKGKGEDKGCGTQYGENKYCKTVRHSHIHGNRCSETNEYIPGLSSIRSS